MATQNAPAPSVRADDGLSTSIRTVPPPSSRPNPARGRRPPWSRASTDWVSASKDRRARYAGGIRPTTAWPSDPTTSSRSSTRGWRSSPRRASGSNTGKVALRPGEHQHDLRGLRRPVRSAQQRRRGGPLRSAGGSMADRDADLRRASRQRPDQRAPTGRAGTGAPRQPGRTCRRSRAAATRSSSRQRRRPAGPGPRRSAGAVSAVRRRRHRRRAPYAMCYAVSTAPDPLGSYYRYEFMRPLFPDYPRPAIWPDGYYIPTSTGDNGSRTRLRRRSTPASSIARRCCKGEPATEQCLIVDERQFPQQRRHRRQGAAAGRRAEHHDGRRRHAARQGLRRRTASTSWQFHVDWKNPANTKIDRAGEDRRRAVSLSVRRAADQLRAAAGHRSSARCAGRQDHGAASSTGRVGGRESIVAVHSVNTAAGGGGVRWYEFGSIDKARP